jgi:hypothetical protein
MQPPQDLIESLIGLKNHYEKVLSNASAINASTKEQIANHANMLLFDPMVEVKDLIEKIVEMRHQWQTLTNNYEREIYHATEQLNHVNALLAPYVEIEHSAANIELLTSTLLSNENRSVAGTQESQTLLPKFLPQYENLTPSGAVESLLKESAGTVLHIDYIARALCGELAPQKAIMSEILKLGVAQSLWYEVPDELDCYTWDLKLVAPSVASVEQKDSKVKSQFLSEYQNVSFYDAIEMVLRESHPRPLTIKAVTQRLFGDVTQQTHKKVTGALVKGANSKRWKRVVGQRGIYIFNDKSQGKNNSK